MAILIKQPEDSFETAFEQGMSQVKKTTQQAAKTILGDVKEQILGSNSNNNSNITEKTAAEQMGVKELPPDEKQRAEQQHKRELDEIRMNFDQINKKIQEIRAKKKREEEEKNKVEEKKKEKKAYVEEKKKESIEAQNAKKGGAREQLKGVSG